MYDGQRLQVLQSVDDFQEAFEHPLETLLEVLLQKLPAVFPVQHHSRYIRMCKQSALTHPWIKQATEAKVSYRIGLKAMQSSLLLARDNDCKPALMC